MADLPLSSEELRRRVPYEATEDVPDELRALEQEGPPEREIRRVERAASDSYQDEGPLVVEGHRPPWVPHSFPPRRTARTHPPIIKHHGHRLEPMFIWQPDNRSTYNDTSYPWGCVCKITTAAGRQGSGVLIGPRQVLTASHCVDWNTSDAEKIEVFRNGATAAATSFDTVVYAFTHVGPEVGYTEMDEDYAVLVTDQRLGDRFGYMGTKTYDSSWDDENVWMTIGYPGDFPFGAEGTVPTYQSGVSLDEDDFDLGSGRAMTTSADVMKGQSGSPMFGLWDDVAYAVAVISSEGEVFLSGAENWCAGGSDLGRLVRQARDENP
jgi:V8-like Glu-specific endopeptidase